MISYVLQRPFLYIMKKEEVPVCYPSFILKFQTVNTQLYKLYYLN